MFGFSTWFSKMHFTSPEKHFQDNCYFSKCWLFLVTSGDCGRNFGLPAIFFRYDYHNCILSDHWNALREKMQFWNFFVFFFTFFRQGANNFGPLAKPSNMVAKIASVVPIGTLWRKPFYWTKFICNFLMVGHWPEIFRLHGKAFFASGFISSAGLTKLPSTCPEEQFEIMLFFLGENYTFLTFSDSDWIKFKHL